MCNRFLLSASCALALLFAGCQPLPAIHSASAQDAIHNDNRLQGRAFYLERIAPAPGATLEVQLIASADSDSPIILGAARFTDLAGPPFDFTLPYDTALAGPQDEWSLRAALRDAQGRLLFFTGTRVVVPKGDPQRIAFRLLRYSGAP